MFLTPTRRAGLARPGLAFLACLASVAAMLAVAPQRAQAGTLDDTSVSTTSQDAPPTGTAITGPSRAAVGETVEFSASTQSSQPIDYWQWNFGDGRPYMDTGTDSTVTYVFTAPGSYTVTASVTDSMGFSAAARMSIDVYDPLVAAFTATPSTVGLGAPVHFDSTGSGTEPSATITAYAWDFGDGLHGTGAAPAHAYQTTGTYMVTETVTDSAGRTATATHDVTVIDSPAAVTTPPADSPPVASFATTTTNPVAASPVSFDGTASSDSDGSIVSYAWAFGDGGTDSRMKPQHTYGKPGDYPVTLTVTDDGGLSRSVTHTVTVADAAPTAAFTSAPNPTAGSPLALDGTGSADPDGSVRQYAWEFGDGDSGSGPSPTHSYAKAGDYDVVLTVTDDAGLTGTVTHTVAVAKAAPVAAFSAPASAVATNPVPFDGTPSSDADGSIASYAWTFGDGTTDTGPTPSHPYAKLGSYTVTLTVTDYDGLTGTTTRTLDVAGAPPVAVFTAPTAAAGTATAFDGTGSSDPDGTLRSYVWDFGDGSPVKAGATPGHTFPEAGSFPVTLTVTDDSGLTNSVTHLVTVGAAALPTALFIPGTSAPEVGTPVIFDGSRSSVPGGVITKYAWSFGDGGTAATAKPSHTYTSAGSFPVTLTVTDAAGHTASVSQVIHAQWPATDLAVAVAGSKSKAGQYTYRVTVKNLGRNPAHGIVLTNTLDSTQVLTSKVTAPSGVSCGGVALGATGTITCKASSAVLAAGKSWVVTFTVKQPLKSKVRQVSETSVVQAANPDGVTENNTARLTTAV